VARVGERCLQGFGGESCGKRHLERPRRRWKLILKWIFKTSDGGMNWMDLARDEGGRLL
jgi:hypothetical protein